ncbi:hemerythrin domain-containing protein [Candidatus Nitrospira bockiana]
MALLSLTSGAGPTIVDLLRKDHERIKGLFREFMAAGEPEAKHRLMRQAVHDLEVHSMAEERVFYPAVRDDAPDAADHVDESMEEHHVAKVLIRELKGMRAADPRLRAKFTVLMENVKHHVKEEEAELFARARTGHLDLVALGRTLEEAKRALEARNAASPPRKRKKAAGDSTRAKASRPGKPRSRSNKSRKRTAA